MAQSPLKKILIIAGLMLVLVVPLLMIQAKINERQQRAMLVSAQISDQYGGEQTLSGPVILVPQVRPYEVMYTDKETGEPRSRVEARHERVARVPETLAIDGRLRTRTLYRGIYGTPVYRSQLNVEAAFPAGWGEPREPAFRDERDAWLMLRVGDLRGLAERPRLRIGDRTLTLLEPDEIPDSLGGNVLVARLPDDLTGPFTVSVELNLNGSRSLAALPLAKETRMMVRGDWPHPGFTGLLLPAEREVGDDGFMGRWYTNSLAAAGAISCAGDNALCPDSQKALRVELVQPVTGLLSSERALKYSYLIVGLTFAAFFLFEVMRRLPVHPMQYLLVGLALAMFYLLLVALGEHLDFAWAYGLGGVACVGVIGVYLGAVLRSARAGWGFAGAEALVLALIYAILNAEDFALLMGSSLLFVTLATVMVLTRHVDWSAAQTRGR
ncbi:MAG: cell envelope integrity protein CreD [Alcanivorax sp.]|uniref:Cell envelope integrity protein CreD n=1 Tax=Alloalcanivorax marinus TaxID=1177169 RepID=A0A9Q3YND9_9GAMM|nr:cell envelope integrity protein CreD [Alloalcanivorax marinus]MCC4309749.1 cell envelope integrity protein CreD [Alloalcanivorax marinus]